LERRPKAAKIRPKRRWINIKRILLGLAALAVAAYAFLAACVLALKWFNPITTGVQIQRRVESWGSQKTYVKRYKPVPMSRIALDLQRAVIAAEDTRFREHSGVDWKVVEKLIEDDLEDGSLGRGGSTITQQLVKNLFLTTHRSVMKKGVEFTLVPLAEFFLGKDRILELYLNVIEWGPGVYGAEAAAQF
jgi:monofunctional biosynthetic peptidoglycan transglycosylase